jgi:hypothetical protein
MRAQLRSQSIHHRLYHGLHTTGDTYQTLQISPTSLHTPHTVHRTHYSTYHTPHTIHHPPSTTHHPPPTAHPAPYTPHPTPHSPRHKAPPKLRSPMPHQLVFARGTSALPPPPLVFHQAILDPLRCLCLRGLLRTEYLQGGRGGGERGERGGVREARGG